MICNMLLLEMLIGKIFGEEYSKMYQKVLTYTSFETEIPLWGLSPRK